MTAAKLFVHAALSGVYGGLLVALTLWIANPDVATGVAGAGTLALVILLYGVAAGLFWPALYGLLRFFASRPLRLSWLSLHHVMAFHVVNTALILAACWTTLRRVRRVIEPETAEHLSMVGTLVALPWLYAVVISLIPPLRRTAWLQASAAGLALAALLAPVLGWPAPETPVTRSERTLHRPQPLERRLVLLNFDGADLEDILTFQSQGKLPALTRLRDEGAYGRLRSISPCEAPVTRTTLVTGKFPYRHGVRAAVARRAFGVGPEVMVVPRGIGFDVVTWPFLSRRFLSMGDRTGLTLWEIAARLGAGAAAAGWDVDLDRSGASKAGTVSDEADRILAAEFMEARAARAGDPVGDRLVRLLARSVRADQRVLEHFERFVEDCRPGVVAVSFPALDSVAHGFLRYARPDAFGDVSESEIERYGRVLENYYLKVDAIVERAMGSCDGEGILFVTSSHGIDEVPLRRRLLSLTFGRESNSGIHDRAPTGFLFARGPDVRAGQMFGRGSIADVVPTALYALGLPIARDMDGTIRAAMFTAWYTSHHPAPVIGSYETLSRTPTPR